MKIWALLLLISTTAFANEAIFDGTDPMTDQELAESETYIHQGQAERIYQDQCVNEDGTIKSECSTDTSTAFEDGSVEQKIEQLMPMIGPAYSMIMGQLPVKHIEKENGGPVLQDKKGNEFIKQEDGSYANSKTKETISAEDQKDLKKKGKDGPDYCGYIPQVGTTAVTFYEQTMDKQTQQNFESATPQTRQAASFQALAKAHKDRAKTAKVQFGVWGATGACYAALMVTNTIQANVGAVAKTGAATLLAYFYSLKVKAHENRAKLLEEMAKEYPGAGDCNPHTATTCFCNEETSPMSDPTNYQNKCVPKGYANNFNNDSFICVNSAGKADPACDCKKTGTCVSAKFKTMGAQIGLNPSMMRDPLAGISPLSNGFGTSKMDDITNKNLAFTKNAMKKIKPDNLNNLGLNSKQTKLAKDLHKAGIPANFARVMAKGARGGSAAPSIATSGLSGGSIGLKGKGMNKAFSAAKQKVSYKGGGKLSSGKSRSSSSGLSRFGRRRGKKGVTGVQIEDFATRAAREAEITKDKSRPIFDIITYRYKASAWREFRDQINAQIEEEKKPKK
jgi:hypothetical protein